MRSVVRCGASEPAGSSPTQIGSFAFANAETIDGAGNIVVAGESIESGNESIAVARYLS
jgi:hypothetical protein